MKHRNPEQPANCGLRYAENWKRTCGVDGTVKEGRIEIQGDKREEVARILAKAGFTPVFAGE
jgi:translation initiation factor 1